MTAGGKELLGPTQAAEVKLGFGDFAEIPEYRDVNRELVSRLVALLPNPFVHVDVATGTGLVPQLLIEAAERQQKEGKVFAIDPNEDSLADAREKTPKSNKVEIEFIRGFGQELETLVAGKIPEEGVDGASIHDAIHEIGREEDKRRVLAAMARILKPRGFLTYNSAFTTVAMVKTPMEWGRWKNRAVAILKGERNRKIVAIKIHTPEEYEQMISDQGLVVVHTAIREVPLSKRALEGISKYPEFLRGVFRDIILAGEKPDEEKTDEEKVSWLELKSQALINALRGLRSDTLARTWHEIIAQKPLPKAA